MKPFSIPVVALGPGSQEESETLNYISMPQGMRTYSAPILPEPEEMAEVGSARRVLNTLSGALAECASSRVRDAFSLNILDLDQAGLTLLNQILGEGEVSAQVTADATVTHIQESVFAGVWRVRQHDETGKLISDVIQVGDIPNEVRWGGLLGDAEVPMTPDIGPGVINAPALLAEIVDKLRQGVTAEAHVINLSLLPFSPEDGAWLDEALGRGGVSILSRGYGNCRITSTAVPNVWWVQFFNSQDALILNTLEVVDVPSVARAAPEDLEDSLERLAEVLEWVS